MLMYLGIHIFIDKNLLFIRVSFLFHLFLRDINVYVLNAYFLSFLIFVVGGGRFCFVLYCFFKIWFLYVALVVLTLMIRLFSNSEMLWLSLLRARIKDVDQHYLACFFLFPLPHKALIYNICPIRTDNISWF